MKLTKWTNSNLIPYFDSFLGPFTGSSDFWDEDAPKFNVPAVNVSESEKEFILDMAVPGKTKDDFEITIDNDMLCISSESEESSTTEEKNFTRKEFNYSSFKRSFRLPENVQSDKINAKYEDGVLHLMIPKSTKSVKKAKMIKVA